MLFQQFIEFIERAQNRDLGAALQMSLSKVTTCISSKAKYKNEKGSQFPLL